VDDAIGGAQDQESVLAISQDTKGIIKKGKLPFKETVMSGDPREKSGELR
jgi:hypothetical protein